MRRTISKVKLRQALTRRLKLINPQFLLDKGNGKVSGSIISETFNRKRDHKRQQMIWDAIEVEFGPESSKLIGTLLAYTPEEWNVDLVPAKKVGEYAHPT